MIVWNHITGGCDLRIRVLFVLMVLLSPFMAVQAHTPNVMMSILKDEGPVPKDVLETAGFVAGDGIKFKVGDSTNNSTMRVSIDLDGDGAFNESVDYFSPWMVYDCQYDENGTLLNSDCVESDVFYFNGSNGTGIYDYQLEKMVNGSHTDFWINTIFVGVDDHTESELPNVGDCFGSGCDNEIVESNESEDTNNQLIPILMIISVVGLVGVSISLINENKLNNEKEDLVGSVLDNDKDKNSNTQNDSVIINNITQNITIQDSDISGDVGNISTEEE